MRSTKEGKALPCILPHWKMCDFLYSNINLSFQTIETKSFELLVRWLFYWLHLNNWIMFKGMYI